jgi:hypothetical protein
MYFRNTELGTAGHALIIREAAPIDWAVIGAVTLTGTLGTFVDPPESNVPAPQPR